MNNASYMHEAYSFFFFFSSEKQMGLVCALVLIKRVTANHWFFVHANQCVKLLACLLIGNGIIYMVLILIQLFTKI